MTHFDFYFDPVCPFAWAASRWLRDRAAAHDADVDWHLMSLAILNEDEEPESDEQRRQLETARRLGRVVAAASAKAGVDTIDPLYTALGKRIHHAGDEMTPTVVSEVLTEAGLPAELADAMDDASFDDAVRESHQRGQDALGEDGGSPILGIDGTFFFGPVLADLPTGDEAEALYSSLVTLAGTSTFAQLKRPADPPTFS
ncbi:DsbA family oxidoreductase [Gordonia sp. GN26]